MDRYSFTKSFASVAAAITADSEYRKMLRANNMPNAARSLTRTGNTLTRRSRWSFDETMM